MRLQCFENLASADKSEKAMIRTAPFTVAGLAFALAGCATLDTWLLDDPASDPVATRHIEERMERFLRSVEVQGEFKDWYTLNGSYLVIRTPLHLRSTFRTHIPYVACGGENPIDWQACRLLHYPLPLTPTSTLERAHETQHP